MDRHTVLLGYAVVLVWSASAMADPPAEAANEPIVTIPLDQVWAYEMRGFKSVFDLEPVQQANSRSQSTANLPGKELSILIARSLCADLSPRWPRDDQTAGPGFAVQGTGRKALEALYEVMVKGKPPLKEFSSKDEITLVFLMYQFGAYAQIQKIERRGTQVEIRWRFIRPISKIQAGHFVLIPLGKLPAGKYRVEMNQQPLGVELDSREYGDLKNSVAEIESDLAWGRRFVNGPFSFEVHSGKP